MWGPCKGTGKGLGSGRGPWAPGVLLCGTPAPKPLRAAEGHRDGLHGLLELPLVRLIVGFVMETWMWGRGRSPVTVTARLGASRAAKNALLTLNLPHCWRLLPPEPPARSVEPSSHPAERGTVGSTSADCALQAPGPRGAPGASAAGGGPGPRPGPAPSQPPAPQPSVLDPAPARGPAAPRGASPMAELLPAATRLPVPSWLPLGVQEARR